METKTHRAAKEEKKRVIRAMAALKQGLSSINLASKFLMVVSGYEEEGEWLNELFTALCRIELDLNDRGFMK